MSYAINFQPKELFSAGQQFGAAWREIINDSIIKIKSEAEYVELKDNKLVAVIDGVQHYFEVIGMIIVNNVAMPQDCIVSKSVIEYINKQNQNE